MIFISDNVMFLNAALFESTERENDTSTIISVAVKATYLQSGWRTYAPLAKQTTPLEKQTPKKSSSYATTG